MRFLSWILKHPISIIIITILVVFIGVYSFFNIPIEIRPSNKTAPINVSEQRIQIIATLSNYDSESIQKILTQPIEEMCMQLPEINSVVSSSGKGIAYLTLSFSKKIKREFVYINVQEKILQLKHQKDFPKNANIKIDPVFENAEEQKQHQSAFFEIQLNGQYSINELRHFAKTIVVPYLNTLEGMSKYEIYGGSDQYILIKLDPNKLDKYNIEANNIVNYLSENFYYKGLGKIEINGDNLLLALDNRPKSIEELAEISIKKGLLLSDVSDISFEYELPTTISRRNFMPIVSIRIFKTAGINALEFSENVSLKIEEIRNSLPKNIELIITEDQSKDLKLELKSMWVRSVIIISIVFLILFVLFRRFFPSFVILMIIFLSFCSAAIFLYSNNNTINIITLAGIALVFGMLVDNAVVVVENIQHYRSLGNSPYNSGLKGTIEIFQPILASSLTTIFVFFSLLLLEDRLGTYYLPMVYSLGFSLFASLILAVILIPAIYITFPNKFEIKKRKRKIFKQNYYPLFLEKLLRIPKTIAIISIILFIVVTYFFVKNVNRGGFFYFPKNKLQTNIFVSAPKGVTLKTLDKIAKSFENVVENEKINAETKTYINENSGYINIQIAYDDEYANSSIPYIVEAKTIGQAVDYAGVGISIRGVFPKSFYNGGYYISSNYNSKVSIIGADYDRLWELSANIIELAKNDLRVGKTIITPSERNLWYIGTSEHNYLYECDYKKLWENNISLNSMRSGLYRIFPSAVWEEEIIIAKNKYPVKLVYKDGLRELNEVEKCLIKTKNNFYLNDFIHQIPERKIRWIDKKNQQYKFTVAWEYRGPYKQQTNHLKKLLESVDLPPGYHIEKQDWSFMTREEEKSFLNLILFAAFGVFIILATLYESFWKPIIIFLSVPFSLFGVFLFYLISQRIFNANSYIGIILLFGIVVNDAIILVERINQILLEESNLKKALVRAGKERFRPIMITTITTIGGLIPILFLSSSNTVLSKILEELSFIMIVGMISSTLLTISLIPIFYYILMKIKMFIQNSYYRS